MGGTGREDIIFVLFFKGSFVEIQINLSIITSSHIFFKIFYCYLFKKLLATIVDFTPL